MKIVVIGGTGLVGEKLVRQLGRAGHETVVAARSTGVDTVTGAGLAEAVAGADVVVDVSNPGYADPEAMLRFFETSGANLFAAEHRAGTRHHIAFSTVGTGRIDTGYYRAKDAQEDLVVASGIPFTIVRSTPLFEYIYAIIDAESDKREVRVPPVRMRPIAADDVARVLTRIAGASPVNAVVEVAGPDIYPLAELAAQILTANEDPRDVVIDKTAPFFGARIGEEPLIGGDRLQQGDMGFEDWLRRSLIPA